MFILSLDDPLWQKLDDAHRNRDLVDMLSSLSKTWNSDLADALFWGHLCHQDTCYGATYAVVPHLLTLASETLDPIARQEIAIFLARVSNVAVRPELLEDGMQLQGMAETREAWDRKLDVYRSLETYEIQTVTNENLPKDVREYAKDQLANLRDVLARPAVNADDLNRIHKIRDAFFQALPKIADLCADVALSAAPDWARYALEGVAASMGDRRLAELLNYGFEGSFSCKSCSSQYEYIVFGNQMAFYEMPEVNANGIRYHDGAEFSQLDYRDGAPNRAAGFVVPWNGEARTKAAEQIAQLLQEKGDTKTEALLDWFTGSFVCAKCGETRAL